MALVDSYIDVTYFTLTNNIPSTQDEHVQNELEALIDKYESKFLTALLGFDFYSSMQGETDFSVTPATSANSPWEELINGDNFIDSNGDKNYWIGFANTQKLSPIANYVYFWYMCQHATITTDAGVVINESEKGVRTTPIQKQCDAWNEMVDYLWIMHEFISTYKTDFSEYIGFKYEPQPLLENAKANQKLFIKKNIYGF